MSSGLAVKGLTPRAHIDHKKTIFLFRLLDMSLICQHVHRLELRFFQFCVAHLPVKREIKTKFNFGHACP